MPQTSLIIGTQNPAKLSAICAALTPLNLSISGLAPQTAALPIEENGRTAAENARIKAVVYARYLNKTVLSVDNALYLDGLAEEEQPGIHTRRIPGWDTRPDDESMLAHYRQVILNLGGKTGGRWEYAVCLAAPGKILGETNLVSERWFVAEASPKRINGYPLESIQVEPTTGQYISEMSPQEQDRFWQEKIGRGLQDFVKTHFV